MEKVTGNEQFVLDANGFNVNASYERSEGESFKTIRFDASKPIIKDEKEIGRINFNASYNVENNTWSGNFYEISQTATGQLQSALAAWSKSKKEEIELKYKTT